MMKTFADVILLIWMSNPKILFTATFWFVKKTIFDPNTPDFF